MTGNSIRYMFKFHYISDLPLLVRMDFTMQMNNEFPSIDL